FGVPAFPLAGVVVVDQRRRLLQVVPPSPTNEQRRVAIGGAVRVADPAFLRHVQLSAQPPLVGLVEVRCRVLGWHGDVADILTGVLLALKLPSLLPEGAFPQAG